MNFHILLWIHDSPIKKFGYNPLVGAGTTETIWTKGGLYQYMTEASAIYVASISADDTLVGTGTRKVFIQGLCEDWCLQSEVVELNGQTPVELENTYIRVFRMYVVESGSTGGAVGVVSVSDGAFVAGVPSGKTLAQVMDGDNQSLMAIFSVPKDHRALIYDYYSNVGKSGEVSFDSCVREYGSNTFNIKRRIQTFENSFTFPNSIPFVFDEKTDIEIRAKASNTAVPASAGFDIILVRKDNT